MAATDGCLACDGENPHTWIITHLSPVATIYSCEPDASINLVGLLASLNNVEFEQLYAAFEAVVYPTEQPYQATEPEKPKRARKRAKAPETPAEQPTEEESDAVEA